MSSNEPAARRNELLGLTQAHLCGEQVLGGLVHVNVQAPLLQLVERAESAGFTVRIASGFRSFERQLAIWNAKALGRREVLDSAGCPLALEYLSSYEKVLAILRWSALPGASRHHWGCDIDVYDAQAVASDYCVQLTQSECEADGVFAPFHAWLTQQLSGPDTNLGFVRPFDIDRGGVAPEPWHLSYAPLADIYSRHLSVELLQQQLAGTQLELKATVLDNLEEIYARFIVINRKM